MYKESDTICFLLGPASVCWATTRKFKSTSGCLRDPRAGRIHSVGLSGPYPKYKSPCWWVESRAATSKLRCDIFPEYLSPSPLSCQQIMEYWRVLGEKGVFFYPWKHFRFSWAIVTHLFSWVMCCNLDLLDMFHPLRLVTVQALMDDYQLTL